MAAADGYHTCVLALKVLTIEDVLLKDEVTGVDPSVFHRYYRDDEEDQQGDNDDAEINAGAYNR